MNMFNFLDPKLLPKVSSKSPATDNYEPENLINSNQAIRARGFLAYTVIKPPVELDFEFICPISIAYICLNTTVGAQKCSGIEIFVKNSSYVSVAKAFYDKSGVVFCDSRKYTKEKPPSCVSEDKALCFFKSDTFRAFTNASAVKVVIFRTNRAVPCLGSIQIIGKPALTCSKTTVDTINRLMDVREISQKSAIEKKTETSNELQFPQDFMDDLTCEIMTIPMTLPSGKTIDRQTLEKHNTNEASFGRKPCDPFTGLKFTDKRKAVMNVPLKSRIDMFLLQNSANPATYGLKRTLGAIPGGAKRAKTNSVGAVKCCCCDVTDLLYVIPCGHFYCRSCLTSLEKKIMCKHCQRNFNKSDAVRHFC